MWHFTLFLYYGNWSAYLFLRHVVDYYGYDKTSDGADAVGEPHQNGGVPWSDVKMVYVVAWYGETTACHA